VKIKKSPSTRSDFGMKRASTQTPPDILRSTSLSALNIPKKQSSSLMSTGNVTRPRAETQKTPPGVSANRITEKKTYTTPPLSPSEHHDHQRSHSPKPKRSNDKSQVVTSSSIIQATREQQLFDQSTTKDITKVFQKSLTFSFSIVFFLGTSFK
jgi:hypothetical protein